MTTLDYILHGEGEALFWKILHLKIGWSMELDFRVCFCGRVFGFSISFPPEVYCITIKIYSVTTVYMLWV